MNQLEAFRDTVRLAEASGMPELPGSDVGLTHLRRMFVTVESADFSEAKLGRWLGWAQCALVAANVGVTLADMKELNVKWAADAAPDQWSPALASRTGIAEVRLVELRHEGKSAQKAAGGFVDPAVLRQCCDVLDRRGEQWAASVLGRDIARRSLTVRRRPYLLAGEDRVLIAADVEEDRLAIAKLDPDRGVRCR